MEKFFKKLGKEVREIREGVKMSVKEIKERLGERRRMEVVRGEHGEKRKVIVWEGKRKIRETSYDYYNDKNGRPGKKSRETTTVFSRTDGSAWYEETIYYTYHQGEKPKICTIERIRRYFEDGDKLSDQRHCVCEFYNEQGKIIGRINELRTPQADDRVEIKNESASLYEWLADGTVVVFELDKGGRLIRVIKGRPLKGKSGKEGGILQDVVEEISELVEEGGKISVESSVSTTRFFYNKGKKEIDRRQGVEPLNNLKWRSYEKIVKELNDKMYREFNRSAPFVPQFI